MTDFQIPADLPPADVRHAIHDARQLSRRASDQLAHQQDQIIAQALTKALGREVALESLRGRLTLVSYTDSDNRRLLLDGKPLIEFYPPRLTEEHRNGSHFLNLSLPYRLFEWELPA